MIRFRDLPYGATFDWVNPDSLHNSFFERCRKVAPRSYEWTDAKGLPLHVSVGSIDAPVFHVTAPDRVLIEPEGRAGLTRRVFRYCVDGALEWAAFDDWTAHGERARFYGYASRTLPESFHFKA